MEERDSACKRQDDLVRHMAETGSSLREIARTVGTNRQRVRDYIRRHQILHPPFLAVRNLDKNGRWRGGRIVDRDGYILLKRPDHPHCDRHGYVREHRLVMEATLGRLLDPSEVVHHLDHDKQNNEAGNLRLFHRNSEHLAEELQGHIPNWTEDGLRRIQEGVRRPRGSRPKTTRTQS